MTCIPWGRARTLPPRLHYCFLTALLSPHPLPSLISSFWICLWELGEEGTQKVFCALEPHRVHFGLIQFGRPVMSDSLWPHGLQLTRLPCLSPTPGAYSNSCLSHQWCHPTISPSPPAFNLSQHQGLFKWVSSSNQVAKVFGFELQHQSFQGIFRTDFLWEWNENWPFPVLWPLLSFPDLLAYPGEGKGYSLQYSGLENWVGFITY